MTLWLVEAYIELHTVNIKCDTRAIEIILDRAYGKASQNLILDGGINFRIPAPIVYNVAPPLAHSENEVEL